MNDLFKQLVWDNIVEAVVARIFLSIPALGWGPLGVIVSFVVSLIATKLYEVLKLSINLQMIVFQNAAHLKAYVEASSKLREIAQSKGIDSAEFRSARNEDKKRLSEFVQFAR